mmetsp:Transcript_3415/g.3841  ORF Transcript_3415/g.3841 Transcript_3415/m.3841 type:complete len:138 (-) Transcript_3415:384-797(-)
MESMRTGVPIKRQRLDEGGSLANSFQLQQAQHGYGYSGDLSSLPSMNYPAYPSQSDRDRDNRGSHKESTTLQVCRDFLRSKCTRPTCSYAHPEASVQIDNGHVTICMDFKLRSCTRPTCKFYHCAAITPPEANVDEQ